MVDSLGGTPQVEIINDNMIQWHPPNEKKQPDEFIRDISKNRGQVPWVKHWVCYP